MVVTQMLYWTEIPEVGVVEFENIHPIRLLHAVFNVDDDAWFVSYRFDV